VKFRAENAARIYGNIPAFADPAATREALKSIADKSDGSVTVDDLAKAFFDNKLGYVQEKNLGPASAEYSDIILQEGGQYLLGKLSLDEAIRNIKQKADAVIQKESR
jgi:multiple sugar transport system substrate-binding protein